MDKFMLLALDEARAGIKKNEGGPFGSVVVRDGEVIGEGHNQVVLFNDATCHGEMQAIRAACKRLGSFDLSGCVLYTTGEPCNMCLSACLWARIDKVYYGCNLSDNDAIGFRDKQIDEAFGGREMLEDYLECIDRESCLELFAEYKSLKNKTNY